MPSIFKSFPSVLVFTLVACSQSNIPTNENCDENDSISDSQHGSNIGVCSSETYNYLALGDSYTIGTSIDYEDNYPNQLVTRFNDSLNISIDNQIIAQNGWTTEDLLLAISSENPASTYDLVTLLIGVNNQYESLDFATYEENLATLLNKVGEFVKGDKNKVMVISIPDYAYTGFGQSLGNPSKISEEIDRYNNFANKYCNDNGLTFVNITDITRRGLNEPDLVASDNLHLSKRAYEKFVNRFIPLVLNKL